MSDDGGAGTGGASPSADGDGLSVSDRRVTQAGSGARRVRRGRTRGWSEDGPRSTRVSVPFSDTEFSDIDAVSERLGMRPGAWIGEVAVRYARNQLRPLPADWREALAALVSARTDVVRVGTLLNQVARHANALGEFEPETARLLAMVERMLGRLDALEAQAAARVRRST